MKKLTITDYMKREDAYPVSRATIRRYVDKGILNGEKLPAGNKATYFVHIHDEPIDNQFTTKLTG